MSDKLLLFSVVRACNPVARTTYTVLLMLNHALSKRACIYSVANLLWSDTFTGVMSSGL